MPTSPSVTLPPAVRSRSPAFRFIVVIRFTASVSVTVMLSFVALVPSDVSSANEATVVLMRLAPVVDPISIVNESAVMVLVISSIRPLWMVTVLFARSSAPPRVKVPV